MGCFSHKSSIEELLLNLAQNYHFCQAVVISLPSVCQGYEVIFCVEFRCHFRVVFCLYGVTCAMLVFKILEGKKFIK